LLAEAEGCFAFLSLMGDTPFKAGAAGITDNIITNFIFSIGIIEIVIVEK
jgi:hypothetical protein